jgi:hypothetical protein
MNTILNIDGQIQNSPILMVLIITNTLGILKLTPFNHQFHEFYKIGSSPTHVGYEFLRGGLGFVPFDF